jgi:hypothetical protein
MADAAFAARTTNDGSRTVHDPFNVSQQTPNTWWAATGPQVFGQRSIAAITDSASAVRFGLPTASLSRAGDDGAGRTFVAANDTGFLAGVTGMVPSADANVLVPDVTSRAPGAYPLTLLTYAAAFPGKLDQTSRDDYANFVEYSTGPGQEPGVEFGQLPPGYTPLPAGLADQAAAAAESIRAGVAEPTTTTTTVEPDTSPTSQPSPAGGAAPQSPRSSGAPATSTATTAAAGPPSAETAESVSPTSTPTSSSVSAATTPETVRVAALTPAVRMSPVARYAIVGIPGSLWWPPACCSPSTTAGAERSLPGTSGRSARSPSPPT